MHTYLTVRPHLGKEAARSFTFETFVGGPAATPKKKTPAQIAAALRAWAARR